jgi:hypothetical protein
MVEFRGGSRSPLFVFLIDQVNDSGALFGGVLHFVAEVAFSGDSRTLFGVMS